jgi:hypothetical protein
METVLDPCRFSSDSRRVCDRFIPFREGVNFAAFSFGEGEIEKRVAPEAADVSKVGCRRATVQAQ